MFRSWIPASVVTLVALFSMLPAADPVPRQGPVNVAPPNAYYVNNPNIDMNGYLKVSVQAARHRQSRRLSEDDFLRMSKEPNTIVLD
ncbi:MAG: hypothetical protein AB7K24_33530, partial [Gemmataceae bacterium]